MVYVLKCFQNFPLWHGSRKDANQPHRRFSHEFNYMNEVKNNRFAPLSAEFLGLLTFMNQTADSKIPTIFSTFVSFEVSCYQFVLITRDG